MHSKNNNYIIQLDVIRALAIILVVFYHLEIQVLNFKIFKGGFLGVDIFFVISGFLISSIIKRDLEKKQFSFYDFAERRIRRIVPLLLFGVIISFVLGFYFLMPTELIDLSNSGISSIFFISNYYFHFSLAAYANISSFLKPLIHTWSLSVEMQFYLAYCLLLIIINKFFKNKALLIFLVIILVSLLLSTWASYKHPGINFYSSITRFWEFLLGASLPYINLKNNLKKKLGLFVYLNLFIIIFLCFYIDHDQAHPGLITLLIIIPTLVLIVFSAYDNYIFRNKILIFIGKISYSLYIWHYIFFSYARHGNFFQTYEQKFIILLASILFSIFSYYFFETKFRDKKLIKKKNFYKLIGLIFIIIFLIKTSISLNNGFKNRLPVVKNYNFDNISLRNEWLKFETLNIKKFPKNNKKNILIIGNSHGQDLYNSLIQNSEEFTDYNFAMISIIEFECFLKKNSLLDECLKNQTQAKLFQTFLDANIIIFHNRWIDRYIAMIPNLKKLIINKKTEIIIGLNRQEFVYNIANSLTLLDKKLFKYIKQYGNVKVDKIFEKTKNDYFEIKDNKIIMLNKKIINMATKHNLKFFDLSNSQCNFFKKKCTIVTNKNQKIYWDYGHITLEGAKFFGKIFFPKIKKALSLE